MPVAGANWVIVLLIVLRAYASVPAAGSKPHIVFAMVDDLGWNGLGFNGNNKEIQTPTIDALAKGGIILNNHYTYKFCSPTRASFLTGRIPGHGIQETNLGQTSEVGCNIALTMIGAKMKEAGYRSVGACSNSHTRPSS